MPAKVKIFVRNIATTKAETDHGWRDVKIHHQVGFLNVLNSCKGMDPSLFSAIVDTLRKVWVC